MADWKQKLEEAGKALFGGGAVGKAAEQVRGRTSRIDEAVDAAMGDSPKPRAAAGVDMGEAGKPWKDTFK